MSLIKRRRVELDAKLRSLESEFDHWKQITTGSGLGRHHSQVRRLVSTIDGAINPLRDKLSKLAKDSPEILLNGESWENEILAAHSIWEVFRSKLVLREDSLFQKKLAACDDLAWECYSPALNLWAPDRRGPPLVYFSATWSPFARSRDTNFQNEIRAPLGTAAALGESNFQAILQELPIPLVSIPWYQLFHMPSALIIAHEIGHLLESDFSLTEEIISALSKAELQHQDVWMGWASEIFADIYGCCAMGPPFAGSMMDLNAAGVNVVQKEDRTYGKYPIRNLRIRLLAETLRQTGHETAAKGLCAEWIAVYDTMTKMVDYVDDLPTVVTAILNGPYRGVRLTDIIQFPQDWCAKLPALGLRASQNLTLENYLEPRLLFAAAQWLHVNPQLAGEKQYENLIEQIIVKSSSAIRLGEQEGTMPSLDPRDSIQYEAKLIVLEAQDRYRGSGLRHLLVKPWLAEDPPPATAPRDRQKS